MYFGFFLRRGDGRPQGQPAQVRKHDVRKAGRQPPPVPHGQRAIPKVASLGATAGAKDGDAYPKQQRRPGALVRLGTPAE